MQKTLKVIIADDHPVVIGGFRMMLEGQEEIVMVGHAGDGRELIARVKELSPDVVFTDIRMPVMDGIEATKAIKESDPLIGVIAFTIFNDEDLVMKMIEAGADGYLLKNCSARELIEAAKAVCNGEKYYSNGTSSQLAKLIAENSKKKGKDNYKPVFTPGEQEVIALMCKEYSIKQIADLTNSTSAAVQNHRYRIMQKLNVRNVVGVVIYAIQNGIFKPEER